ncbi:MULTISPECIES: copper chaperone PCu(A)C [Nonomuraea]|uniref:Copper chaperone PCu(A)C n=1 Tax=Nonomuraea ferruginea TaxID=46174 RepID=A0ABT4TBZ6_9ACTN|nr:copper chaperone PCu(A)C [Nonomuraea ferruginea]MDA0646960.1 copper chaperone PCu(A)C [Nonomuraea ferruginea]
MNTRSALLVTATAVLIAGCGAATPAAGPAPTTSVEAAAPAQALTITDPWVKAVKEGMTAAFGTLVNHTDSPITVVAGASPLSPEIELHEVVESDKKMIMRPKEGGFVVPARGSHELKPGGDHIMLMGVKEEVKPGAEIPITLTLQEGPPLEFTAVGKDFAGAKEDYQPGTDH